MYLELPVRYWPCCPRPAVPLAAYDEKALAYGRGTLDHTGMAYGYTTTAAEFLASAGAGSERP